jgi:serine/threonine-protein kinase RsbW
MKTDIRLAEEHDLIIDSRPEELLVVEDFIDKLNSKYMFREDMYGNILVSVTEAVNNAIIHGNKRDPSKKVVISAVTPNPFLLSILVEDEGQGFDWVGVTSLDPTNPEALLSSNGRGLFVIQNLCDKIIFHNDGAAIEMQFNI